MNSLFSSFMLHHEFFLLNLFQKFHAIFLLFIFSDFKVFGDHLIRSCFLPKGENNKKLSVLRGPKLCAPNNFYITTLPYIFVAVLAKT